MKVYLDKGFCCHAKGSGMREIEIPFFDGKCTAFIEGYRYVPPGEVWMREDGELFRGEMLSPIRDYALLEAMQQQYEADEKEKADMREALRVLGVE